MKLIREVIYFLCGLALAIPMMIGASPHAHAATMARSCTELHSEQVVAATPDYSQVKWTTNSCGWLIQDRSKCRNAQVQTIFTYSGKVKAVGLWDRASCTSAYSQIIAAAYRTSSNGGTTWTSWVTYWNL